MNIVYVTDRLSLRGGADQHLLQVIESAVSAGARVTVASGDRGHGVSLPAVARSVRMRGLGSAVASEKRLRGLDKLLDGSDVVHVQNVMNPIPLRRAVGTGRAVVTVQDHRVFCPGKGKTMPDGARCRSPMSDGPCAVCLPDREYRGRLLELTEARMKALKGAMIVALSKYVATELEASGLADVQVVPPWVEVGRSREDAGQGFLLAGRLVSHKAPSDGVRAWLSSACGQPLRVAGAGPLKTALENAEHLGWLTVEQLRSELRRSRALLFPSFWQEPFGILGIQALAEGTPVIVADSGGTADWSDAGCIRVSQGDVSGMAEAIRQLADDPERALELGEQGRQMIAERFSRSRHEPRLHEIYEMAASRGP